MTRERGFTLVELLVVVAVIAVLVAILVPTMGRARELGRKAVCGTRLGSFGTAVATYVGTYRSYPHFGPWPWSTAPNGYRFLTMDYPGPGQLSNYPSCAWPKTYALLETLGLPGTNRTLWGVWAYLWEADEIWQGALCPAMDAAAILDWANGAPNDLYIPIWKVRMHKAAAGYQWNFRLRAATPCGRWRPRPDTAPDIRGDPNCALCQNLDYELFLPDGSCYAAQAVRPEEIDNAGSCAEAWDSPDFATLDWRTQTRYWQMENLMPGHFCGPQVRGTNGWALLNAARHPGSPNILYADGSVRADATRKVKEAELGPCPSGNWKGLNVTSWSDWNDTFGTLHHVIPMPRL